MEEPNCHIFLKPEIIETDDVEVFVPEIGEDLCDHCGRCVRFCRYNALAVSKDVVMNFPELCHSCGGCKLACPKNAINEVPMVTCTIKHGKPGGLNISYGVLNIEEAMATDIEIPDYTRKASHSPRKRRNTRKCSKTCMKKSKRAVEHMSTRLCLRELTC